jgi:hypothetical protein
MNHKIIHQIKLILAVIGMLCSTSVCAEVSWQPSYTQTAKAFQAISTEGQIQIIHVSSQTAALSSFLMNFSNQQEALEQGLADLLRLPKVQIKTYGQTVLIGADESIVGRIYLDINQSRIEGINVSIYLKSRICLAEDIWLDIVDSTLAINKFNHGDLKDQPIETAWRQYSGGPHWPPDAVLRSRRFQNNIAVSYRYFLKAQPRCINSPGFTFPQNLEINK